MLVCPRCGARLPVGTVFCGQCGMSFAPVTAAPPSKPLRWTPNRIALAIVAAIFLVPILWSVAKTYSHAAGLQQQDEKIERERQWRHNVLEEMARQERKHRGEPEPP